MDIHCNCFDYIKARKRQEKKLKKLDKQQKRRLAAQKRHQAKEAKLYGK